MPASHAASLERCYPVFGSLTDSSTSPSLGCRRNDAEGYRRRQPGTRTGPLAEEIALFPTLTDEQRRFVATVRELAQSEFRERAPRYMDGTFPWENMKPLAELGVLGMAVPEEYGGLGLPVFDTALVLEEIAKACYVTAMAVLGEVGVQTRIIATYAPEAIKRRILPAVCSGECLLAICMTEPDAGTDVANYKTNVDRVGNTLRLNGVKTLISRAEEAGMFVVFTRVDKKPGREGIGCVLVEKGTPGLFGDRHLPHDGRREPARDPLRGCRIAAGEPGARGRVPQTARRLQHPALPQPAASRWASPRARSRRRSNTPRSAAPSAAPIAEFQGMRWKIAEMYRDIEASRCDPLPRLRQRRPVPRPAAWRPPPRSLQRDGAAGDQRGDPGAWRLRLHRRVPGLALLPRRPLRHPGRRHHRDPARPDRQARPGRRRPDRRHLRAWARFEGWRR